MSKKEMQKKRKEMTIEAEINNPNITKAKRFVLIISAIWLTSRLIHIIYDYVLANETNEYQSAIQNTVMLIVLGLFMITVYQGYRSIAILPILGSAYSIIKAIGDNPEILPLVFKSGDGFFIGYFVAFFAVMTVQAVLMVIILTNKKYKEYSDTVININKKLQNEFTAPKL